MDTKGIEGVEATRDKAQDKARHSIAQREDERAQLWQDLFEEGELWQRRRRHRDDNGR